MNNLREKAGLLILGLLALLFGMLIIGSVSKIFGLNNNNDLKQLQIDVHDLKNQVQISDYSSKDTMKKADIALEFSNSVKNDKATNEIRKNIKIKGSISRGYLYIKSSVDSQPLTQFDSIYVKFISKVGSQVNEFGGHLRRDKSLSVPTSDNYTELLYN